jgi:hypothetical protein
VLASNLATSLKLRNRATDVFATRSDHVRQSRLGYVKWYLQSVRGRLPELIRQVKERSSDLCGNIAKGPVGILQISPHYPAGVSPKHQQH